jgi:hypothetical protein
MANHFAPLKQHLGIFIAEMGWIHIAAEHAKYVDILFGQRSLHSGRGPEFDFIKGSVGGHVSEPPLEIVSEPEPRCRRAAPPQPTAFVLPHPTARQR